MRRPPKRGKRSRPPRKVRNVFSGVPSQKSGKKADKHKPLRSRPARRRNTETGLEGLWGFFLPGREIAIEGIYPCGRPRSTPEYEKMKVREIALRIICDVGELRARVDPTGYKDWSGVHDRRSEQRGPDVMPDFVGHTHSSDETIGQDAADQPLVESQKLLSEERESAAEALAFIGKLTASHLESLYWNEKQRPLLQAVAARCSLWPVNLGVRFRAEKQQASVTRKAFADSYIKELNLNRQSTMPNDHMGGRDEVSPFTIAAKTLYQGLQFLRAGCFGTLGNSWEGRVLALPLPMTLSSASQWWAVAKELLDDCWKNAPHRFEPYTKHLNISELSAKTPSESVKKSRVIDNAMKEAFKALARPDM